MIYIDAKKVIETRIAESMGFDKYKQIILQAMFESMYRHFAFTKEQLDAFISDFILGLPGYMRTALAKTA